MANFKVLAAIGVAALLTAACGSSNHVLSIKFEDRGSFSETALAANGPGATCSPDFGAELRVTVADATGKVVANGVYHTPDRGNTMTSTGCMTGNEMRLDVPDASFYKLSVEGFPGATTVSKNELEKDNWTTLVALTY